MLKNNELSAFRKIAIMASSSDLPLSNLNESTNLIVNDIIESADPAVSETVSVTPKHPDNAEYARRAVNEENYSITNLLSKELAVKSGQWTLAGSVLDSLMLVNIMSLADVGLLWKQSRAMFTLLRTGFRLRLSLNGQPMYQGKLILVYFPSNYRTSGFVLNRTTLSQLPHCMIDANQSTEAHLDIPYTLWYPNRPNNETRTGSAGSDTLLLGEVGLYIFNELYNGTSTFPLDWVLYMSFTSPEMHVTQQPATTTFASSTALAHGLLDFLLPSTNTPSTKNPPKKGSAAKLASPSHLEGLADIATSALEHIPEIAEFCLDQPAIYQMTNPVKVETMHNPSQTYGPNYSTRLATTQYGGHGFTPSSVGGDNSDMSIAAGLRFKTYLQTLMWVQEDAINRVLWSSFVSPALCLYYPAPAATKFNSYWELTSLAFYSEPFTFWRGAIDFTFELVKTDFHTGKLLIAFLPARTQYSAAQSFDVVSLMNNPHKIIDISGDSVTSFSCPYNHYKNYLLVHGAKSTSSETTKFAQLSDNYLDTCSGYIAVVVLNPLRSTTVAASNIQINMYISAGDGFEVAVPMGLQYRSYGNPNGTAGAAFALEEAPVAVATTLSNTSRYDGPSDPSLSLGNMAPRELSSHFNGEKYDSESDLTGRHSIVGSYFLDTSMAVNVVVIPVCPSHFEYDPASNPTDVTFTRTFQQYFTLNKLYWSGSNSFKIVLNNSKNYATLAYCYHYLTYRQANEFDYWLPGSDTAPFEDPTAIRIGPLNGAISPRPIDFAQPSTYAYSVTNLAQNPTFEVTVPFYNHNEACKTVRNRQVGNDTGSFIINTHDYNAGYLVVSMSKDSDSTVTEPLSITIYQASGHDYRTSVRLPCPRKYDNGLLFDSVDVGGGVF